MTYCKDYCEERGISTSKLTEAQKALYYVAENMKMEKSISKEGYKYFNMAIEALEQSDALEKIKAEIEQEITYKPMEMRDYRMGLTKALDIIDKYRVEQGVSE